MPSHTYEDYKVVFAEQRAHGLDDSCEIWMASVHAISGIQTSGNSVIDRSHIVEYLPLEDAEPLGWSAIRLKPGSFSAEVVVRTRDLK